MALTQVNRRGPCFCNGNCPPQTRPWQKYLVKTDNAIPFANYFLGRLYTIDVHAAGVTFCRWIPHVADPAFGTETLIKESVQIPADPFEYSWACHLQKGAGPPFDFFNFITWDPDNSPFDPDVLPACGAQDVRLLQPGFPFALKADIRPVPEWCCSDAQAQAWAVKYPLP